MKKTKNLWFRAMNIDDWLDEKNFPPDRKIDQLRNITSRFMTHQVKYNEPIEDNKRLTELYHWCEENFYSRYCLWDDQIDCSTEEDAMAFKLRWT